MANRDADFHELEFVEILKEIVPEQKLCGHFSNLSALNHPWAAAAV